MTNETSYPEGVVVLADKDGNITGDWFWPWSTDGVGKMTPRHGFDALIDGRKIQVSITRARKKLSVYVDGIEFEGSSHD